jgi:hypothetical protein
LITQYIGLVKVKINESVSKGKKGKSPHFPEKTVAHERSVLKWKLETEWFNRKGWGNHFPTVGNEASSFSFFSRHS